jgi:hypothetical protein
MTMPCSLKGTNIEALHNPTVGTSIMSKFLAKNLLGNMPLVPTNKLFKSPLGLFFECCGITRAMLVTINEIEVFIDFHIFAILEFDLLIWYPLDKLCQEKYPHGSLSEKFRKAASATHLKIPMADHIPNQDPFKEVKFISLLISHRFPCEIEHASSPSLKLKQCPSGCQNVVLDSDQDSTLILHDLSLEVINSYAMDILLSGTCSYEDSNHLLILISKLFRRIVMDAYVYQKYCKSRSCIVALTL